MLEALLRSSRLRVRKYSFLIEENPEKEALK